MAYDKKKIYKQAIDAITKNNLFFIEDIVAFLPISKKTYYEYFPLESNESNTLKELLEENKVKTKSSIRAKLYKSGKSSELIPLYRLIGTLEEKRALNQSYVDHTTDGQKLEQESRITIINNDKEIDLGLE
jgi:hypothetical protein